MDEGGLTVQSVEYGESEEEQLKVGDPRERKANPCQASLTFLNAEEISIRRERRMRNFR